jgi:hypothetical protein
MTTRSSGWRARQVTEPGRWTLVFAVCEFEGAVPGVRRERLRSRDVLYRSASCVTGLYCGTFERHHRVEGISANFVVQRSRADRHAVTGC